MASAEPSAFLCPTCKSPATESEDRTLTCPNGHVTTLAKYYWQVKGVGALMEKMELRCPNCNRLFCEGDFSDKGQRFKCRNCKEFSTFIRLS